MHTMRCSYLHLCDKYCVCQWWRQRSAIAASALLTWDILHERIRPTHRPFTVCAFCCEFLWHNLLSCFNIKSTAIPRVWIHRCRNVLDFTYYGVHTSLYVSSCTYVSVSVSVCSYLCIHRVSQNVSSSVSVIYEPLSIACPERNT